jgi:LAO/AO transport system kinase
LAPGNSAAELEARILSGDVRALARAATLVENRHPLGRDLMRLLFPRTGRAIIAGITGPPGAGKSTLADRLTSLAREDRQRVAVLAVDPTSPCSGGAILGDRIRMQRHHADPGVFIRSLASRGASGGIAAATLELALLLDAAGFDWVFIETVGAGQDEIAVAQIVGVTVVVLAPGFGDDIQAIKAGMMEIAGVFAINKCDTAGAGQLEQDILASGTPAPVQKVSALSGEGCPDLMATIRRLSNDNPAKSSGHTLWAARLKQILCAEVLARISNADLQEHAARLAAKLEDPFTAAVSLLETIGNSRQPNG